MTCPVLEVFSKSGIFGVINHTDNSRPVTLSKTEADALKIISSILSGIENIHVERRSDAYLSVVAGEFGDFCRIKISDRSKWMSLDLWKCDESLKNDARLISVKNKNQRHWKIMLSDVDDIRSYIDFVIAAYNANKTIR